MNTINLNDPNSSIDKKEFWAAHIEPEQKIRSNSSFTLSYYPPLLVPQPDDASIYFRGVLFRILPILRSPDAAKISDLAYVVLQYLAAPNKPLPKALHNTVTVLNSKGEGAALQVIMEKALADKVAQPRLAAAIAESTSKFLIERADSLNRENIYFPKTPTIGLPAIASTKEGSRYILLDGMKISAGTTKSVRYALECQTGMWAASALIDNTGKDGDREFRAFKRVEKIQGCLRMLCAFNYQNEKKDEVTRILTPLYTRGTLIDIIKSGNAKPQDKAAIMIELLRILDRTIQKELIVCDLKPENIFVRDGEIVIGDVGAVWKMRDIDKLSQHTTTAWYAPPDYAKAYLMPAKTLADSMDKAAAYLASSTEKLVVWSLGCILYDLWFRTPQNAFSKLPWAKGELEAMLHLAALKDDWWAEPPKKTYEHIIWQMLRVDPKDRPTINQLLALTQTCP